MIRQFQLLAESGALGPQAEASIPLLEYALYSEDKELRGAALDSLKTMNTPKSKETLLSYKKTISRY